jgi:hypothetical protein
MLSFVSQLVKLINLDSASVQSTAPERRSSAIGAAKSKQFEDTLMATAVQKVNAPGISALRVEPLTARSERRSVT